MKRKPFLLMVPDKSLLILLALAMELEGFDVYELKNVESLKDSMNTICPIGLVMCVPEKDLTKIVLAAEVSRHLGNIPIVAISPFKQVLNNAKKVAPDLVAAILQKPVDWRKLIAVLHEISGKSD